MKNIIWALTISVTVTHQLWQNPASTSAGRGTFVNRIATPDNRPPKRNIYFNGTDYIVNPWYGWQPPLYAPMKCSWLQCTERNHSCGKDCRDDPEDMNFTMNNDDSSMLSLDPGENWVPDATMLRRMFIDGYDADGNPWPPPLDDDLCEITGTKYLNVTRELFDAVPIIGAPISKEEAKTNRVLCMIYSIETAHAGKIRAIRETWAPGCDGFLVFSNVNDPRIPAVKVQVRYKESYGNMWQKIRGMFQFVGKHYIDQFDWFYMGGDDLVVYPQNLKNHLATYNSSNPHFVGRRFRVMGKQFINKTQLFNTGGAGYALSRPALKSFLEHMEDEVCQPRKKTSIEDVMTAQCLEHACNITLEDTRDEKKRERFHHWWPEFEYSYKGGGFWYKRYNRDWGLQYGKDCCSPETINFHYIKDPGMLRYLFHYPQNCGQRTS